MDTRYFIIIIHIFFYSCNEISCRFNNLPDPPYPNPDRVEEFKTSLINQVTYIYECLDNEKYPKQFVAITYTIQRSIIDPDDKSLDCWNESVYVNLGNC